MGEVDPEAMALLDKPILGHLGFVGLDGYPRVLTVWFRHVDGEIHIATRPDEYKGRSLRANGRAALTVATPEAPYLTINVVADAAVEPLPEKQRIELIGWLARYYMPSELADRYLERWLEGGHPGDGELIRLKPRRYGYWRS